ncbi:S-layer homology domain-containing protein [Candidatus Peregrinibacteria bacterium]|jgi:hypothetical protein|nr:S-layer homology domain-containing protein [Candidatus Peregrinibacteria bacterium]MBT4147879.1 S-layer homology domain-containing protein [Candidatus Peregrinibacteria bacterium]MBT4455847.1 S-layer homology domain-containing protein [Candidatus Peregrinibacteria bacterium]
MKRLLTHICLVSIFSLSLGLTAFAAPHFNDVGEGNFWYDPVEFLAGEGMADGYADGSFGAGEGINRAEILKIIFEANNDASILNDSYDTDCFKDVPENSWYVKYVCYAKEKEWVEGYPDGTFQPSQPVNFVEALRMLIKGFDGNYQETTPWYKGIVDEGASENIIPLDITSFSADLLRGQMADMIARKVKYDRGELSDYLGKQIDYVVTYDTISQGTYMFKEYTQENPDWYTPTTSSDPATFDKYSSSKHGFYIDFSKDWYLSDSTSNIGNSLALLCRTGADCTSNSIAVSVISPSGLEYYVNDGRVVDTIERDGEEDIHVVESPSSDSVARIYLVKIQSGDYLKLMTQNESQYISEVEDIVKTADVVDIYYSTAQDDYYGTNGENLKINDVSFVYDSCDGSPADVYFSMKNEGDSDIDDAELKIVFENNSSEEMVDYTKDFSVDSGMMSGQKIFIFDDDSLAEAAYANFYINDDSFAKIAIAPSPDNFICN